MRPDPTSLSLFVAAVEEGTIAGAARREHIAAAAVSTRLRDLEAGLGTRLLRRSNKGIEATAAGLALLGLARGVLHSIDDAVQQLRDYSSGVRGHVRVFSNISAIAQWLPGEIHSFLEAHPQVQIHLEERISSAVARAVAENAADVGLFTAPFGGELEVFPYHSDRLVLIVPRGHPLGRRKQAAFADAVPYSFVGLHTGSAINLVLLRAASELNQTLQLRIQVTSFDALCRMVSAGLGIGILPGSLVAPYARPLGVKVLRLEEPWAERELRIGVRAFETLPVAARLFVQHLARGALPSPGGR